MSRSHARRPREALLLAALGIVGFATAAALLDGRPDGSEALSFVAVAPVAAPVEPRRDERPQRLEATRTAEPLAPPIESPADPGADASADDDDRELAEDDSVPDPLLFVHGMVVNVVGGAGIAFATIEVDDDKCRATITANGCGEFRCRVPEGCTLRATAPGCDTQEAYVPWRTDEPQREVELELSPAGSLLGRLVVPAGVDATEATVRVDVEEIVRGDWPATLERPVASDGSFRFDDVPLGSLVVVEAVVAGRALGRSLPLAMPDEYGARITTIVELRARAVVRGTIAYEDGAPAEEWCVALRRVDDGEEFDDATTVEEDGSFEFADLPAGEYEAVTGYRSDYVGPAERTARFRLDPGGARELRLVVERGLPVSGTVIRERPEPRTFGCGREVGVCLLLVREDEERWSIPMCRDDHDQFRFEHVPAGEWRLSFGDASIMVNAGDTDLVLRESRPGTIRGLVRAVDGADVWVGLLVDDELRATSRGTNFEFDPTSPCVASIIVNAPGSRWRRIDGLRVSPGTDLDLGEIVVEPAPLLRGFVVDHEGAPVSGARLYSLALRRPRCGGEQSLSDLAIRSTNFSGGEAGFALPFDGSAEELWIDTDQGGIAVDPTELPPSSLAAPTTIRLPPPRRIFGRVMTPDGRSVPHVEVAVRRGAPWESTNRQDVSSTTTDADGAFEIRVLAGGRWTLEVRGDCIGAGTGARAITLDGDELDVGAIVLPW